MNARGERILIFGDSLTHPGQDSAPAIQAITQDTNRASSAPGDLLGSILLEQGAAAVQTDAKVGRSALSFWQAEPAAQLVAADQAFAPTKVIVMLGTNDASRDPTATEQAMVQLRDTYKGMGAEVWAVGPMTYAGSGASLNAPADAIFGAMQHVFGKAQTIDARPLSAGLTQLGVDRAGDGIHFTQAGARQLAPQIASVLLAAKPGVSWPKIALAAGGTIAIGAVVWAIAQRTRAPMRMLPAGVEGRPIRPSSTTESQPGYVYHATNEERAHAISTEGLKPHGPSWGTDQSEWPDGSRERRSYWTRRASVAHSFAPEDGKPVLLRVAEAPIFKIERGTGDIVTTKTVPGGTIEILTDEGWEPLKAWAQPQHKLEGLWFKPRTIAGPAELPADVMKKWKRGIAAYNKAIADTAAGDREAFGRAVTARGKLDKIIDEAAAHVPGSYKDPAIDALHAEKAALPKIADAEEQGRIARGKQYDEDRKKLIAEQREVDREYDWMKR